MQRKKHNQPPIAMSNLYLMMPDRSRLRQAMAARRWAIKQS